MDQQGERDPTLRSTRCIPIRTAGAPARNSVTDCSRDGRNSTGNEIEVVQREHGVDVASREGASEVYRRRDGRKSETATMCSLPVYKVDCSVYLAADMRRALSTTRVGLIKTIERLGQLRACASS